MNTDDPLAPLPTTIQAQAQGQGAARRRHSHENTTWTAAATSPIAGAGGASSLASSASSSAASAWVDPTAAGDPDLASWIAYTPPPPPSQQQQQQQMQQSFAVMSLASVQEHHTSEDLVVRPFSPGHTGHLIGGRAARRTVGGDGTAVPTLSTVLTAAATTAASPSAALGLHTAASPTSTSILLSSPTAAAVTRTTTAAVTTSPFAPPGSGANNPLALGSQEDLTFEGSDDAYGSASGIMAGGDDPHNYNNYYYSSTSAASGLRRVGSGQASTDLDSNSDTVAYVSAAATAAAAAAAVASYRVVGVLPAPRGTSNRVVIYVSPLVPRPPPPPPPSHIALASPPSMLATTGFGMQHHHQQQHQVPRLAHASMMSLPGGLRQGIPTPGTGLQQHQQHQQNQQHGRPGILSHPRTPLVHGGSSTPSLASPPPLHEALKEIDHDSFAAEKILVRLSTQDASLTERLVSGEWKGRARANELYTANRFPTIPGLTEAPPRITVTKPGGVSGDKSGFVALNTLCKAAKMQSVYLASELRDVGLFQGAQIPALWFKVSDVPDRALENVRVAISWTLEDHLTEFCDPSELRCVFGPKTLVVGDLKTGWVRFPLDAPVEWNGRSNLVVEFSKDETHASFSWPATGGLFFKATSHVRSVAHKDNNDSSGVYPFATWSKPARFRRVPLLAMEAVCPASYKIVCDVPEAMFHGALVKVEVAIDGVHFSKSPASYVHCDRGPAALHRVLADLSRLLPRAPAAAPMTPPLVLPMSSPQESSASPTPDDDGAEENSSRGGGAAVAAGDGVSGTLTALQQSASLSAAGSPSLIASAFHDVIFLVGTDHTEFCAHRAILASRSPVFHAMFTDQSVIAQQQQQTGFFSAPQEIHVPELSARIFGLVLGFIYTANISVPLDSACELLKAADMYALTDLKRPCENLIKQSTSFENVTTLLLDAERFHVPSVRSFTLEFLLWHFDAVSRDATFARDILPRADLVRELLLARRRGPFAPQYPLAAPMQQRIPGGDGSIAGAGVVTTAAGAAGGGGAGNGGGMAAAVTTAGGVGATAATTTGAAVATGGNVAPPQAMATFSFPSGLFNDLKRLLDSGPLGFPDVRIVVGDPSMDDVSKSSRTTGSATTRVFYAHKVILCTRCEVLEAMLLRSPMTEATTHSISIPNITPAVFESLLSFLYVGRCELSYKNVFPLYRAADQYQLHDLKTAVEEYLVAELSLDNVGNILLDSDEHHVTPIRSYAIDLAIKEFDDVSVTISFLTNVVPRQDLLLEILRGRGPL
ncbi:hypothetical protein BC828DRAFT_376623 [Blastocladiella britannica]|nr:hypothetical protein BC828DRAFT_376623 [Blastocladiella britannica]